MFSLALKGNYCKRQDLDVLVFSFEFLPKLTQCNVSFSFEKSTNRFRGILSIDIAYRYPMIRSSWDAVLWFMNLVLTRLDPLHNCMIRQLVEKLHLILP